MKSILRILAASSALFLILSPSVLAAPLAQETTTSPPAESEFPDGYDSNAVAGKFGEPECRDLDLEVVCLASNAGGYCSHDGYKVLKPELVGKCSFPACFCR